MKYQIQQSLLIRRVMSFWLITLLYYSSPLWDKRAINNNISLKRVIPSSIFWQEVPIVNGRKKEWKA